MNDEPLKPRLIVVAGPKTALITSVNSSALKAIGRSPIAPSLRA